MKQFLIALALMMGVMTGSAMAQTSVPGSSGSAVMPRYEGPTGIPENPMALPTDCGVHTSLVGKKIHMVDLKALQKAPVEKIRVVNIADPVTMEFAPSRLTIVIDGAGKIRDAHCG